MNSLFFHCIYRKIHNKMTFKKYRDSLRNKKYNSLPKKEANIFAIEKKELDKLAVTHQRLVMKAISSLVNFNNKTDDYLFELVQVGIFFRFHDEWVHINRNRFVISGSSDANITRIYNL